jgi:hypothetical protein
MEIYACTSFAPFSSTLGLDPIRLGRFALGRMLVRVHVLNPLGNALAELFVNQGKHVCHRDRSESSHM